MWLYRHTLVSSLLAFASCAGQSLPSSSEIIVLLASVVVWSFVVGGLRMSSWIKASSVRNV